MILVFEFFSPYAQYLIGAAYNISQTLEGLEITSSTYVIEDPNYVLSPVYFDPTQNVVLLLGALLLYAIILIVLLLLASYVLGRKWGLFLSLVLLLLPGVLSLLDVLPDLNFVPDNYVISGTGVLGSGWGAFPLFTMGLLTGWVATIVLSDILNLKDKRGFNS